MSLFPFKLRVFPIVHLIFYLFLPSYAQIPPHLPAGGLSSKCYVSSVSVCVTIYMGLNTFHLPSCNSSLAIGVCCILHCCRLYITFPHNLKYQYFQRFQMVNVWAKNHWGFVLAWWVINMVSYKKEMQPTPLPAGSALCETVLELIRVFAWRRRHTLVPNQVLNESDTFMVY